MSAPQGLKAYSRKAAIRTLIAIAFAWIATGTAGAATIAISCGALGRELDMCRQGAEAWAQRTGHKVNLVPTPNSSSDRLALYQQLLAAKASDVDVFEIDVIWPGILGNHFVDLRQRAAAAIDAHFPAMVRNDTVAGRLVAIPWFTDAGVLFYRKDLLEKHHAPVPVTWGELTATAQRIQDAERAAGNAGMWGFVWQGRAYEGLTCNGLEWIVSYGDGTIVDADGRITVSNPRAVAALEEARHWVGTITPIGVLNYAEEEARGVFQLGNAVFMRNWPYAWALANSPGSPVRGKVGVTTLPSGGKQGRPAAALGGGQLAVSRYSRNPDVAADLVMFLTGAAEQKRRAIQGSYIPTVVSLYKDRDVLDANPFITTLYDTVVNAVPRPSTVTGVRYNQVSAEFWNAVHAVLSGQAQAEDRLKELEQRLTRLRRGGQW